MKLRSKKTRASTSPSNPALLCTGILMLYALHLIPLSSLSGIVWQKPSHPAMRVELASQVSQDPRYVDSLLVNLDSNGSLWLNNEMMSDLNALNQEFYTVYQNLRKGPRPTTPAITLQVDQNCPYSFFLQALSVCRRHTPYVRLAYKQG